MSKSCLSQVTHSSHFKVIFESRLKRAVIEMPSSHGLDQLASNYPNHRTSNYPRNGRRFTGTLAFHCIAGQSEAVDAGKSRDRGAQPRPPKAGSWFSQRLRPRCGRLWTAKPLSRWACEVGRLRAWSVVGSSQG